MRDVNALLSFKNSTKGKSDTIGISQFIDFLNDKQRDPRLNEILYPLYNEKRATEIIDEYEADKENRARRKFQQFFEFKSVLRDITFRKRTPEQGWLHSLPDVR